MARSSPTARRSESALGTQRRGSFYLENLPTNATPVERQVQDSQSWAARKSEAGGSSGVTAAKSLATKVDIPSADSARSARSSRPGSDSARAPRPRQTSKENSARPGNPTGSQKTGLRTSDRNRDDDSGSSSRSADRGRRVRFPARYSHAGIRDGSEHRIGRSAGIDAASAAP